GGAHPFGTAAAPLRPPRVERLMFRCKPSTAGVVWLIAAPAFSLSRECRPACHADHFDAVSLPSDRSLPIRYPEVRPACNSIRTGTRSCLAVLQRRGRSRRARSRPARSGALATSPQCRASLLLARMVRSSKGCASWAMSKERISSSSGAPWRGSTSDFPRSWQSLCDSAGAIGGHNKHFEIRVSRGGASVCAHHLQRVY